MSSADVSVSAGSSIITAAPRDEMRCSIRRLVATMNHYGLKRQVTIPLDDATIAYFNGLAEETGIRYQTLINLYLRDQSEEVVGRMAH